MICSCRFHIQNTYILGDLENKIPLDTKIKWYEVKNEMRANKKEPNLKDFAEFYTKLVYSVREAQHMRTAMDGINSGNENVKRGAHRNVESKAEKKNLLATSVRSSKSMDTKPVKPTNHNAPKDSKKLGNLPQKGKYLKSYCYFCNSVGHSPNFCKGFKPSFDEKKYLAV